MCCFIMMIFLVVYQIQDSVNANLTQDQKDCIDDIKLEFNISAHGKPQRTLIAKNAFLDHRVDEDPEKCTLKTDDAKKYFYAIYPYITYDKVSDVANSFEIFCSRFVYDVYIGQLKASFPFGLDKIEMGDWIYLNRVMSDIPQNHTYAADYMMLISNRIDFNPRKFVLPATFCMSLYNYDGPPRKKQRIIDSEISNTSDEEPDV